MRLFPPILALAFAALAGAALAGAAEAAVPERRDVHIGMIAHRLPPPPTYSYNAVPQDEGFAGARIGIKENDTTGAFTGWRYLLDEAALADGESPVQAAEKLIDGGAGFLVVDLPADELVAVADAVKGRDVILFNVGAPDDALRQEQCRANVFHVAPSRSMLTDALAQFLAFRRWRNLFLVVGPHPADKLYADAVKHSARKFGLTIAAEKPWEFGPLALTKADSPSKAEALVFTRGPTYDILVVADEEGEFGDYLYLRTWDPRPMAGTQGLVPTSWHPTHEFWGAAQLQNRFLRAAKRWMRPLDYQAWVAVKTVGEAVTRTKQADPKEIARFLASPDFEIGTFKGVGVSFRPWNQQMRQPILLAQPTALVSVAPESGFLHQRTPLDTLGIDLPESKCRLQ